MRRFSIHSTHRFSPGFTGAGALGTPEQGDKEPYTSVWDSPKSTRRSTRLTSVACCMSKNCTNTGHRYEIFENT